MTDVLIRRGGDAGRDWSEAAASLGLPEWEEARKDPPLEASEEAWHGQHLHLRLLDSRISKYLLFESTQFGVLSYSSPSKPTQMRRGLTLRCEVWYKARSRITIIESQQDAQRPVCTKPATPEQVQ